MDARLGGIEPTSALRLQVAQEAAQLGYWDYEIGTGRLVWDEACAALFGVAVDDFGGTIADFDRLCHPDDIDNVRTVLSATRAGETLELTYRVVRPDGEVRDMLARGSATPAEDGTIERMVGVVLDVTDLRAAAEGERRAAERVSRLAGVALAMAGAQSHSELTRIVIEHGAVVLDADGGAVCVRDDERRVIRLAMSDSLGADVQLEFGELPLDGPLPGSYTARTGIEVFLPNRAAGLAFSPAMQIVYDGTDRDAWAVLPLRSGSRLLGSLVVSWAEAREFGEDERELLAAFAAQTAQALGRIQALQAERRQAEEARRLSETMQRDLLTSPPQADRLQVAVRYAPASQEAAVGGDWYDAFVVPDGTLNLVIGDCVGHDRQAAASMATMRNLLRATAFAVEEPPALVLAALERTLHGLEVDVLATAMLMRVEWAGEPDRQCRRLVWSNAGHLPPVVRLPDGTARVLEGSPDLLLGLSPSAPRMDNETVLPPASTVLLFTDGLVERRGEDIDEGIERLRRLVAELGHLPLEQLSDALLANLLDAEAEDDVALLAFRTAPDEGPSPRDPSRVVADMGSTAVRVQEHSLTLPPEAASVPAARHLVTGMLVTAGREDWIPAAELAVSEVVTNAVIHAHTALTLTVLVSAEDVRVEVRDDSPVLPTRRSYGAQATTGRGMALVAAVASSHGVTPLGRLGKVVWFSVGPPVEEPDHDALLDAWAPVDLDVAAPAGHPDDEVSIRLLGMPPTLWLAARQHDDALLREIGLRRAGVGTGMSDLAEADRARSAVSTALDRAIAQARARGLAERPLPTNHPAPLEEVPPAIDLEVVLPRSAGAAFAHLQDVLDEGEQLAHQGRLLVRPALPEVIAIRDWACEQVIAQLGGTTPAPWPGTDAERFTARVGDGKLSDLDWDPASLATSDRGAVAADDANRIVAITRPLAEALGWRPEDLVGRRVVALVPPRYREAHVAGFTRHLTTGEAHALGVDLDLPVLRADGSEVLCTFFIEAHRTAAGRTVYVAWITPKD